MIYCINVLKSKNFWKAAFIFLCAIGSFNVGAAENRESSAKFHGELVVIECSINSGQNQVVNFGSSVGISRIDGKRYEQTVPFVLNCQNYAGGKVPSLKLTLEGTASSFDNAALATNVNGLGIEIKNNNKPQPLNQAVTFDYDKPPVLTAVPVADPTVELVAQDFFTTLKITVEVA